MLKEINILTLLAVFGLATAQTRQLFGNPDGVVFPSAISSRTTQPKSSDIGLSVQMAKTIGSLDSVEEFLKLVNGVPEEQYDVLIGSRFGEEERSNAAMARPARCIPELQPVPFSPEHHDPSTVYFPSCTRVKRCGGCCEHPLLSCQPTESVTKNFQVVVTKVGHHGTLDYSEKQIIPLEEHTKCKCDCKVKPEHCTGKQVYIEDRCTCSCSNVDEEEKCKRSHETKLWDPALCACLCRSERDCNSGFYFDPISCSCQQQRWLSSSQRRTGYNEPEARKSSSSQQPFLVPLASDSRRRQNKDDPEYK